MTDTETTAETAMETAVETSANQNDTQADILGFDPLQVSISGYDGPLDLLLQLVRKQKLDIQEVRLAELTEPYLAHIEHIRQLNLDQAGDFLAIASTLIWIKSRSLLPRDELLEDELDPDTVEEMLLLRLREYQRFKDAGVELSGRDLLGRDIFPRRPGSEDEEKTSEEGHVFEEVTLFGLLEAFRDILLKAGSLNELSILPDRSKIELKIEHVLNVLSSRREIYFNEFFEEGMDRAHIVLTFIALLELVRLKALRIQQLQALGPIHCKATDSFLEGGQDYKEKILEGMFGTKNKTDPIEPEEKKKPPLKQTEPEDPAQEKLLL
ncbi:MAG: segregation/condensation protein A [Deltaproteobacteria bacterium]|nr:segregation/condensation protein A [Deltaproteobacteria bacterium]